jgi:hypothetical protein
MLAVLIVAAVAAALSVVPPSRTAAAAEPRITGPASMRYCTNLAKPGCDRVGSWDPGPVTMACYIDDSIPPGHTSSRWYYVVRGTRKSFVHSSWIANPVAVPRCRSSHPGVMALWWAAIQFGSTRPTQAQRNALGPPTSGIDGWSGYCPLFTAAAYRLGFGIRPRFAGPTAHDIYVKYRDNHLTHNWTIAAPVGSMLFWPATSQLPLGHTAIYAGNAHVVTTQGYPGDGLPIRRRHVSYWGNPAGGVPYWVAPGNV